LVTDYSVYHIHDIKDSTILPLTTAEYRRPPPNTADHLKTTVDHLKTIADHLKASQNAFYSLRYNKGVVEDHGTQGTQFTQNFHFFIKNESNLIIIK
jgi:hypothetical protein